MSEMGMVIYSPYPEEMNRLLTGRIASYHFAPTIRNKQNLEREGIIKNVYVTGNTVIDAFKMTIKEYYRFTVEHLNHIDFETHRIIRLLRKFILSVAMNKKYIIKNGRGKRMNETVKYKIKKQILKFEIGRKIYKIHVERPFIEEQRKRKRLSSKKKFKRLKNICKGKRCYIIGNGPSLTIDDLNCLKNEDTFGVNRIFKIFDQTDWRPTYYCAQDSNMLEEIYRDLEAMCDIFKYVFLNSTVKGLINDLERENLFYLFLNIKPYDNQLPEFSEEICDGVIEGYTVTYACIQLAVYMGYSEIYLIGLDHNYSFTACEDGSATQDDPSKNYMKGLEGKLVSTPELDKSTLAYRKAALVCEKKNIVIKNATRGGKLEEFERVKFDDLIHDS